MFGVTKACLVQEEVFHLTFEPYRVSHFCIQICTHYRTHGHMTIIQMEGTYYVTERQSDPTQKENAASILYRQHHVVTGRKISPFSKRFMSITKYPKMSNFLVSCTKH